MSSNNFKKELFTRHIESECKRQLFLDLASNYPKKWYPDRRAILPPDPFRRVPKFLLKFGKKYEQKIYSILKSIDGVKYNLKEKSKNKDKVGRTSLNLGQLYIDLKNSPFNDFILLEYQFIIPETFFIDVFPPKKGAEKEIPVNYGQQRPDIMIIGSSRNKQKEKDKDKDKVLELLSDGSVREVPSSELDIRYGINIIDIKNIREDRIGKKQFVEILYYLWTMAFYLKENKFDDRFFVRIDFNGILPLYISEDLVRLQSVEEIFRLIIEIHWDDSYQIYTDMIAKISKIWSKCPKPIKSTSVNIQPTCGYCHFLEDCKNSLGMDGVTKPKDWALELIPYTSSSVAHQLKDLGYKTIGDVLANISSIHIGNTPQPIYSELPLLNLKTMALSYDDIIFPEAGQTNTYSIPQYSQISITLAVETDPANLRVYAAGFYLAMSISNRAHYGPIFFNWWRIWKNAIEKGESVAEIQTSLNEYLIRKIDEEDVTLFLDLLKNKLKLKLPLIFLEGEKTKAGNLRKQTQVIYQYATVNKDNTNDSEAEFTKNIIKKLWAALELANIIEIYVVTDGYRAGTYYGPSTGLFYWAKRQLNNFQDMLERNLSYIIGDDEVWGKFLSIISLFTPSDSEVAHPYQHKKLFDIQVFAETLMGFPSIISYTWHEIAKRKRNTLVNRAYWIPHFNYMDFNNWYRMLDDKKTPEEKEEKRKEIQKQIMHKIRTIHSLRLDFQINSRFVISQHARIIGKERIRQAILSSNFHSIAHVWFIFSKLTGSKDEMEVEYFRTTYPEFSIGKLAAAKVSNLKVHAREEKCSYSFQICDLSSNMKIKVGDRVLLIPDEKRDIRSDKRIEAWKITISSMFWSSRINGYLIKTEETNRSLFQKIIDDPDIPNNPADLVWYLYPTSLDVWSNKLYNATKNNGLLQRHNLGISWLGERLSLLWEIRSKQELKWPEKWTFSAPSIYLYAPKLLKIDDDLKNSSKKLLTPIFPTPDPSQKKAINLALSKVISGIQGPPGTGKSRTIAAMIDEFYLRSISNGKKSVKILITAFSYAAIRVLIEMIRKSRDEKGNPTRASQLQMIFLRSEHQNPISSKSGFRNVDDLVRYGSTWKMNSQSYSVTKSKLLEESLNNSFIMFANAHQLFYLPQRVDEDFAFDLICVDEASQLPVDNFMSCLQFIYKHQFTILQPENAEPGIRVKDKDKTKVEELELGKKINEDCLTKVVIVGDLNQLPPVQPVPPPKNLEKILDSLFSYYVKHHKIPNTELQVNYRSHKHIVGFTNQLGVYGDLTPNNESAERIIQGNISRIHQPWLQDILDPNKIVITIIHKRKYEIGVSEFEAKIVVMLICGYFEMKDIKSKKEERDFWNEYIGVVAPHNAQGRQIIRRIYDKLTDSEKPETNLDRAELMEILRTTIYSVEKFQGSDRELIISSIGISDKDQLDAESKFIFNLNRFNVLTSRAKSKVILVASKKFLKYIPGERAIMEHAAKIHNYAFKYCNLSKRIVIKNENGIDESIEFRFKG